ncbi:hypothetical protein AcW1_002728 [Taiwanofungus camphoratus]|nr:hypothetical protein AcW1_002728 [Antrodia cinnamomea]
MALMRDADEQQECKPKPDSYLGTPDDSNVETRWDISEAWSACAKALREHDESMVQGWKEEIDTLLVFAGLFSAILTAFNIESYQSLQEDPMSSTNHVLLQISSQLTSFSVSSGFLNSTEPLLSPPPPFRPSSSAVRINVLWFSGLVCSLISTSLCIFVKQWLREYTSNTSSVSRESVRMRQHRYHGLVYWRVPEIIVCLPMLLQIALVLFFAGLLDLLWSLNTTVAGTVTVLIVLSMTFSVVTVILPSLYSDCPYKSPQSWMLCVVIQSLKRLLVIICEQSYNRFQHLVMDPFASKPHVPSRLPLVMRAWLYPLSFTKTYSSWKEREKAVVRITDTQLDGLALASADAIFMDDGFLNKVIRPCLTDVEPSAASMCLNRILVRRAPRIISGLPYWDYSEVEDKGTTTLMHLALDVLMKLDPEEDDGSCGEAQLHVVEVMHRLIRAIPFSTGNHSVRTLLGRLSDTLACTLDRAPYTVRERAFQLILKFFPQFRSIGPKGIIAFIGYSKRMRADNMPYRFLQSCYMIIMASAVGNLAENDYNCIRESLSNMLIDLETFFLLPVSRTADYIPPISMQAMFCYALLALAHKDLDIVGCDLVNVLDEIVSRQVTSNDPDDDLMSERHVALARESLEKMRYLHVVKGRRCTLPE